MSHIKQILLPNEQVIFRGTVHSIVYLRGLIYLSCAYAIWLYGWSLIAWWPWLARMAGKAVYYLPLLQQGQDALIVAFGVLGVTHIIKAFLICTSTEFAVTNHRVLAKFGITTTLTLEMDKDKVAGVTVLQPPLGQLLGYGWVHVRGFSGDIHGLPPLSKPHRLQQALYQ